MDTKYLNRLLLIKIILAYLLLCCIFFLAAGHQINYRAYNLEADKQEDTVGEITDGNVVEQYFRYEGDYIHSIRVLAGTYARENHGKLQMDLLDGSGELLGQDVKELEDIEDNTPLEFTLDDTLKQGMHEFILRIRSEGCSEGNAVTLYCSTSMDTLQGKLFAAEAAKQAVLTMEICGGMKYPWYGCYWYAVFAGAVLLVLFYLRQYDREQQGAQCMLHRICATLDTYQFLIKQLAARDFKTKYKRSVLGAFWSFLNPLCTMAVQYVVFSTIFRSNIRNYPVYLLSASILFNFFTESVGGGLVSIVGNASLITKVYVPKYIYPVTKVLSTAINLVISMVPLLVVICITKEPVTGAYLLIPYAFLCLLLFSIGMSLFLSSLMVFFRDMQFLWGIISLLWMYATPMFYPEEIIPGRFRFVLDCNPMYHYISFFRTILLGHVSPQLGEYVLCMAFSLTFAAAGAWFFQHCQKKFVLYL